MPGETSTAGLASAVGRFGPAAAVVAGLALAPLLDHGSTQCFSRTQLGVSCPSCGLTRGVGSLVRGDVAHSIEMNPMAIALVATAVVFAVGFLLGRKHLNDALLAKWMPLAIALNGAALVATWLVRLSAGTLPPP